MGTFVNGRSGFSPLPPDLPAISEAKKIFTGKSGATALSAFD